MLWLWTAVARWFPMFDLVSSSPGAALWVVGYRGSLLHSDRGASALLTEGSLLYLDGAERLRCVDPSADRSLQDCLAPCRRGRAAKSGKLNFVSGDLDYRLLIYPLDDPDYRLPKHADGAAPERLAALIRLDAHKCLRPPVQDLQVRFGLTSAEAAVALAFSDGRPLHEIARSRGIAFATARNQLQAAREKIGASNQADLMRRLFGFATIAGAEE